MLNREEWQENPPTPIDSVCEAEMALRERDELIKLMGEIIYKQNKIIRNAVNEDGSPSVSYDEYSGMDWKRGYVNDAYRELMEELMPRLPNDWTDTLEV